MTDKRKIKQQKSNRRSDNNVGKNKGSPRNEFRRRRGGGGEGHPTHIYRKVGSTYEFIGITHSDVTRGVKNIKLDKNPNPRDKQTAYLKSMPERASTREFHKQVENNWKFAKSDLSKVEQIKGKPIKDKSHRKRDNKNERQ